MYVQRTYRKNKNKGVQVIFKEILSEHFLQLDERHNIHNMQHESRIFNANSIPSHIVKL